MGKRAVFVMAMFWGSGCVVVSDGGGGAPPGDAGDDACAEGCEALDACGLCLPDGAGGCLDVFSCADQCRATGEDELGGCLAGARCDDAAVAACYDATDIGDDACAQGCLALDACDLCAEEGECLTPRQCAEVCREAGDDDVYACVAEVRGCGQEAIDACFDRDAIGDDACAQGCLALDACDLCETGDGDECLTPAACAEACREAELDARFGCLAEVDACDADAIDACYDDAPPADACAAGCAALDACDLCLEDEEGACLSIDACAEACRAGGSAANSACVAEVEGCDADAIEACFAEAPAPSCDVVCQRVVECAQPADADAALAACVADCAEFTDETRTCVVDAAECPAVGACVERDFACEAVCAGLDACDLGQPGGCTCAGFSPEARACLDAAMDCEVRAACLNPAPPAPTCADACARRADCDMVPGEERDAAVAECVASCDGEDAARLRCVVEAPACGDVPACDAPAECAAICGRAAECGDAGEGCAEACVRDTGPELRACLLAAADCEAAAACERAARCELVCERTAGCGLAVGPDCAAECAATLTPEQLGCALEAECADLPACTEGA